MDDTNRIAFPSEGKAQPSADDTFAFLNMLEPGDAVFTHEFCWFVQTNEGRSRQFYAPLCEDSLKVLTDLNEQGYNIFVCINAIDTPVYVEGGLGLKAKRRAQDITRVRAVFGDFDDPAIPLPWFPVTPTCIVRTSPGKHHVYWRTAELLLELFRPVQEGIIQLYGASGADRSVKDLSRVMRVPGFLHMKNPSNPHAVTFVKFPNRKVYPPSTFPCRVPQANPPIVYAPCEAVNPIAALVYEFAKLNGIVCEDHIDLPCPWTHLHTNGNPTAAYFPPATINGGRGGFKCLHSHCAHRNIHDFTLWVVRRCEGANHV
jgi:hypothetical protein